MSRYRIQKRSSFTRPANTTAYAANDLVANNVTAGSVAPLEFAIARYPGGAGAIKGVSIAKSATDVTNAQFRVHLFSAAPTSSVGDNGAFAITNGVAKGYLGSIDVTVGKALGDGSFGRAAADLLFDTDKPSSKVFVLLEALAAYGPASAETFTVSLDVERD